MVTSCDQQMDVPCSLRTDLVLGLKARSKDCVSDRHRVSLQAPGGHYRVPFGPSLARGAKGPLHTSKSYTRLQAREEATLAHEDSRSRRLRDRNVAN